MAAHQAPPSLGFSRQERWSGPFPSSMHESEKWKWNRLVVSNSKWPQGLQPTRLLHPWDFPGKSTRVGCHCLLQWLANGFYIMGFSGDSYGKESACSVGDLGSTLASGKSPGEENGNPHHYSCLGNYMDKGAWQATVDGLQRVGHNWATNTVYKMRYGKGLIKNKLLDFNLSI